MAGDDDLRLNTLHRFAKHSPRLVLHEYSHCEVPAGCGGVVLQWYDPAAGSPAMVRVAGDGVEGDCWLDGAPLASSLARLRAGPRLLAVHVRRKEPGARPFTVGMVYDGDDDTELLGGGRATWRAALAPPPEGWTAPGFDDGAWADAPRAPEELIGAQGRWVQHLCSEAAAEGRPALAIERDELWLRVAFVAPEAPR